MSALDQQPGKNLAQLLQGLEILHIRGDETIPVTGLAYHSGRVQPGDVFVALKGYQTDGHLYITKAIENGARALIVENELPSYPGIVQVRTPDTRLALAHMAAAFAGHPSHDLPVIGITGTNGKTTTSYILEAIWQARGDRVGVIGTVNCRFAGLVRPSPVTTPESLDLQILLQEMQDHDINCAIMEVSSHALDLKRAHACRFAGAVFTNLSQDHLDYHRDLENYFAAKSLLFTELLARRRRRARSGGHQCGRSLGKEAALTNVDAGPDLWLRPRGRYPSGNLYPLFPGDQGAPCHSLRSPGHQLAPGRSL